MFYKISNSCFQDYRANITLFSQLANPKGVKSVKLIEEERAISLVFLAKINAFMGFRSNCVIFA